MSTAKSIQARVFGGQESSGTNGRQSPAPLATDLSIQIPKPKLNRPGPGKVALDPAPSKPKKKKDEARSKVPPDSRPYRERLVEKLGTQYDGVERHRLEQDLNKERHWKRWGPYLSERQWV